MIRLLAYYDIYLFLNIYYLNLLYLNLLGTVQ